MAGGTAEIGIRVFLESDAASELAAITSGLKQMQAAAKSASQAIQSLSDALASLNGGAAEKVAAEMDAGAVAVDNLKSAESELATTGSEAAAAQSEVASSMQEQVAATQEGVASSTEMAAAQQEVVASTQEHAQAAAEDALATQESTSSTMSLEEARAQLLGTLQAELEAESVGVQMMQEIAAEEKAAASAATDLGASTQTVQEKVLGANDALTQFNVGTEAVAGEVRGLVPVLDEAGNATGAWAYASGTASEAVKGLRADGQGLVQTVTSTTQAEKDAKNSTATWMDEIAGAVNEFIALGFVLQMAVSFMGNFIAQGAAIQDSLFTIQGLTGATDQQMMTWGTDIGYLDQQFGQLETDSISALDLITKGGFQAADATIVLQQAMTLADASGETLATTTKAITLAMDIFHLSADQAQQVAVAFFTALSSSTLPLSDYITLLDQSGLTAKQLGISVTDLISTLGHMGQVMGGSTMTVRELQGVLDGLLTFTEQDSASIAKLAGGFNQAAFAAANSEGRFLMLAQAADGNTASFTRMVGGVNNAQTALNALDISTKQLEINAAKLGLSFDPVAYNSMNAAQKLLYLATISDFSSTKFTALTKGGVEPATAALLSLVPALEASAQKLSSMTPAFNMAAFNAADLSQKLHMLADYVGGPNSPDFAKFVGGAKNVALAIQIMNQEADKTPGHFQPATQAVIQHGKAYAGMATQVDQASSNYQSQLTKMQDAAARTANDAQHQTAAMKSAWQQLSNDFVTQFGPAITAVLKNVDQSLINTGKQGNIAANLFWSPFPGLQNHLQTFFQWVSDHFSQTFGHQVPSEIQNGTPAVQNATNQYTQGVQTSLNHGTINWGNVLKTFFTQTVPQIIGLGFIRADSETQSGTNKINSTLNSGGQNWAATVGHWLSNIINIFSNFQNVLVGHSIVPDTVNLISSTFSAGGARWQSIMTAAINNLISAMSTLPSRALAIVNSMISSVLSALTGMDGRMFSSGLAAAEQFAAGIAAGAANAIAQAWNIANQVAAILAHHSPPKEGPMKDDDTWMPNMMHMFTEGIQQNIPLFTHAVTNAAAGAAASISSVPQLSRMSNPVSPFAGAGAVGGNITIPVVLDSQVIATATINRLTGQMQMNGLGRAFR